MKKLLIIAAASMPLFTTSCATSDLPPATQMQLEEIEQELGPYFDEYDVDGDGDLDEEELVDVPPSELERIAALTARYDELYREGIAANVGFFTSFLRATGIPAPPGSEVALLPLVSLAYRRPRRQLVKALKELSPAGGGPSFYEAGKSLLSIVGYLDSTEAGREAAEEAAAMVNDPVQSEQETTQEG